MKRKLFALALLAALVLLSVRKIEQRADLLFDSKDRLKSRILKGGLLAAAAVLAFPLLEFWPAVAIATGVLAITGGLASIGKAFKSECPPGYTRDDDSDVCLGLF